MAELDLQDVVKGIRTKFSEQNHFVFWFDRSGDFSDNFDEITKLLKNTFTPDQPFATIFMHQNEQFKTKLKLVELQEKETYVLIYSPASVPSLSQNFLADFLRFSATYTANAAIMLREELGLPDENDANQFVEDNRKFFANKDRIRRFKQIQDTKQTYDAYAMRALASLMHVNESRLTPVLQAVLHGSITEDNVGLQEFTKYNLFSAFWTFVEQAFGYHGPRQLRLLCTAIWLNYAFDQMGQEIPNGFRSNYGLGNLNNAITFIQNSQRLKDSDHDMHRIAEAVYEFINGSHVFAKIEIGKMAQVDAFPEIDQSITLWITERLIARDLAATAGKLSLPNLIRARLDMNYHSEYESVYTMQQNAITILLSHVTSDGDDIEQVAQHYISSDAAVDTAYRVFVAARLNLSPEQEGLVAGLNDVVEEFYLHDFLVPSIHTWNDAYLPTKVPVRHRQRNFYENYISESKDRVVVIISDAFRFEAAQQLYEQLDYKDTMTVSMDWMVTGLPSVTYMGMAALLPHKKLSYIDNSEVLIDGVQTNTTVLRENILRARNEESIATTVDSFRSEMNTEQRKQFLSGKKVVYLYHNQIDVVGEALKTENEVFPSTEKAIDELKKTIDLLRNLSVVNIIVTADHGYIYHQSSIDETDKIQLPNTNFVKKEQRYAICDHSIDETGVRSFSLGELLGNDDSRFVSTPINANIFKSPGAAQNYVHGGSSLQEMLVPVLNVKTQSGRSQAVSAQIRDVTNINRITARDFNVRIMQEDPISETVRPANYTIYFADNQRQAVSGKIHFSADLISPNSAERIRSLRLTLSNQSLENREDYELILENDETGEQVASKYQLDLTIGGDFGFDF
ncbi:BREX-1 system phosphatase PglZ type A [Oenococcus sp.]|uniref:BREX-1 system phosphatase PglZ type A n=1 Tax=Oenococcus sp. TaxID=1979414 RepID=UPI0039E7A4A2